MMWWNEIKRANVIFFAKLCYVNKLFIMLKKSLFIFQEHKNLKVDFLLLLVENYKNQMITLKYKLIW